MDITIIGMGQVGSAVAFGCLLSDQIDVSLLDLIDTDMKKLLGEYADLVQTAQLLNLDTKIGLPLIPRQSDIYIISAGNRLKEVNDKDELVAENMDIVMEYMEKISKVRHENSVVFMVTNPSTELTKIALDYSPLVIPIGNLLDNARLRLSKVEGTHEKPDIQEQYRLVKESKGYTNWAVASEIITRIRQLRWMF